MEVFIWSIVFGIIGIGYFSFGRKRDNAVFLYSGIGLMIFPYFLDGLTGIIIVGIILTVVPLASSYLFR